MIGRNIEVIVGAYTGVWGKIVNVAFDEYYILALWNNTDISMLAKDGNFKLVD